MINMAEQEKTTYTAEEVSAGKIPEGRKRTLNPDGSQTLFTGAAADGHRSFGHTSEIYYINGQQVSRDDLDKYRSSGKDPAQYLMDKGKKDAEYSQQARVSRSSGAESRIQHPNAHPGFLRSDGTRDTEISRPGPDSVQGQSTRIQPGSHGVVGRRFGGSPEGIQSVNGLPMKTPIQGGGHFGK